MLVHLMGTGALQNARTAVTDTSNTPRWPDIEFIQPLDGVGPNAPSEDGNDCGLDHAVKAAASVAVSAVASATNTIV